MNIIDKTHRAEHLRPVPGVIDRLNLKGFKNYKAKHFGNTDDATREERWRGKLGNREDEGELMILGKLIPLRMRMSVELWRDL